MKKCRAPISSDRIRFRLFLEGRNRFRSISTRFGALKKCEWEKQLYLNNLQYKISEDPGVLYDIRLGSVVALGVCRQISKYFTSRFFFFFFELQDFFCIICIGYNIPTRLKPCSRNVTDKSHLTSNCMAVTRRQNWLSNLPYNIIVM